MNAFKNILLFFCCLLIVPLSGNHLFAKTHENAVIFHFPQAQANFPAHIGKDTCIIIDANMKYDKSICVDGGTLIVNAPFRMHDLLLKSGNIQIRSVLSAKYIEVRDSGMVNHRYVFADSIQLNGKGDLFINNGRIYIQKLGIASRCRFVNKNYVYSTELAIADGGILFNQWKSLVQTSSKELANYKKVVGCYECTYTIHISDYITSLDWLLFGIYTLVIICIAFFIKKKITRHIGKFLIPGLILKIAFSIVGVLIYAFYYGNGDNFGYYNCIVAMNKFLLIQPNQAIHLFLNDNSPQILTQLDRISDYTIYSLYFRPINSFTTLKLMAPAFLLGANSLLAGLVVINAIAYIGIWKLYTGLCKLYPHAYKVFAIGLLFMPSVLLWSSALLKDTVVFSTLCWFFYNLIQLFICKEKRVMNAMMLILNLIIISCIKPYVLLALIPFIPIIVINERLKMAMKRVQKLTLIFTCILIGSMVDYGYMHATKWLAESQYGSVGEVVTKARVTQEDHLRAEQYGDNAYNIGKIDHGFWNNPVLKAPQALFAGLFRPFPTEIANPLMIVPALENLFLLFCVLFTLFKTYKKPWLDDPFLLMLIGFVILYSYGIGLSSANFGALSRFKIMILPMVMAFVGIRWYRPNHKDMA